MKIHTFAVGLLTAAMAVQVVPGRVWGVEVGGVAAGGNAAEVYRRAFEAADRGKVGESGVLQCDMGQVVLDKTARELLARNLEAVGLVREGAKVEGCDWGEVDGDMQKVMDVLNGATSVGRLSVLQARQEVVDGDPEAAVGDWMASVALARRVGGMNLLVARLAGEGIEVSAIKDMAAALPGLPAGARGKLAEGWGKLPSPGTGEEWVMGEYAFAKKKVVREGVGMAWVEVLEPFYKGIAGAAGRSPGEFGKVVDAEFAKVKLNPFAQILAPSFKRARESLAVVEAQRGMLETALAVVEKGKGEVKKSKDPFGEGAFTYNEAEGGFELGSGLVVKGKAVGLRVGGK